jgi:transcriptional regulator with XRE-family HTH domain
MTTAAVDALFPSIASSGDVGPAVSRWSGHVFAPWEGPLLAELGQVLQEARIAAGLTLEDLGPIVGSASSLASIEAGIVRTRATRLRPWLEHLRVDPDPIIERFAAVLAPERPDGRNAWRPVAPVERREPRALALPPLPAHEQAALGAELWRIRVQAGLTRPALAALLRVSRIHVWLVEHGQRGPSEELVDAWLSAAGRPADRDLFALRFPGPALARRRRAPVGAPPGLSRGKTTQPTPASEGDPR